MLQVLLVVGACTLTVAIALVLIVWGPELQKGWDEWQRVVYVRRTVEEDLQAVEWRAPFETLADIESLPISLAKDALLKRWRAKFEIWFWLQCQDKFASLRQAPRYRDFLEQNDRVITFLEDCEQYLDPKHYQEQASVWQKIVSERSEYENKSNVS